MGSFAETMFDWADVDQDGFISKEEVDKLPARDFEGKPPISKRQYVEWAITKLELGQRNINGRRFPTSGFRRPAAPPQARRGASDNQEKNSETDSEKKKIEAGDSDKK